MPAPARKIALAPAAPAPKAAPLSRKAPNKAGKKSKQPVAPAEFCNDAVAGFIMVNNVPTPGTPVPGKPAAKVYDMVDDLHTLKGELEAIRAEYAAKEQALKAKVLEKILKNQPGTVNVPGSGSYVAQVCRKLDSLGIAGATEAERAETVEMMKVLLGVHFSRYFDEKVTGVTYTINPVPANPGEESDLDIVREAHRKDAWDPTQIDEMVKATTTTRIDVRAQAYLVDMQTPAVMYGILGAQNVIDPDTNLPIPVAERYEMLRQSVVITRSNGTSLKFVTDGSGDETEAE